MIVKIDDDIIDPLKDFSPDLRTALNFTTKIGYITSDGESVSRLILNATQTQQVLALPISEERKKMAVKQQDNIDVLLGLKGKK